MCAGGEALGIEDEPSVAPASDALGRSQPGVGLAVVLSLALLFAGVSLGQLGLNRARARRAPVSDAPALDASTPRNATVAKIFLKHGPAQVAALGQALERGDAQQISITAHKLKGSCLAIGASRMAELCALLEAGTSGHAQHYAELCRNFERAERELTAELVSAADSTS